MDWTQFNPLEQVTASGHSRNSDKQKDDQESISVDDLPASGKVWAQVNGKVDGKDKEVLA